MPSMKETLEFLDRTLVALEGAGKATPKNKTYTVQLANMRPDGSKDGFQTLTGLSQSVAKKLVAAQKGEGGEATIVPEE